MFIFNWLFQLRKDESVPHSENPIANFYYQHISHFKARVKQTKLRSAQLIQRVDFNFLIIYTEVCQHGATLDKCSHGYA